MKLRILEGDGKLNGGRLAAKNGLSFEADLWYSFCAPMESKPIPSDLAAAAPSVASRLFSFANQKRLRMWFWLGLCLLFLGACIFIEIQTSLLQSWFFTSTNEQL